MDLIIILGLIYLVLCWILAQYISKEHNRSNKIYRIAVMISSVVVVLGCITPLNFVFMFLLADIIVFVTWGILKIRHKNIENQKH